MSDDNILLTPDATRVYDDACVALPRVMLALAVARAKQTGHRAVEREDMAAVFYEACSEVSVKACGRELQPAEPQRAHATAIIHEGTRKLLLVLQHAAAIDDFIFHDGQFFRVSSVGHSAAGTYALVHVAGDKLPHEFHWILSPQT